MFFNDLIGPMNIMLAHIESRLDTILREHPHAGIVIMGDFNTLPDHKLRNSYNLKQVVNKATRGDRILDKILTNMHPHFKCPDVFSPIGTADHNVVVYTPLPYFISPESDVKVVLTRSSSPNQRAFFADAIIKVNWQPLYTMDNCQKQCDFFQSTITTILDEHMPLKEKNKYLSDKPWVTTQFKDLIEQRQVAFMDGNEPKYKRLRNKVNKLNKQLKGNYYKSKVENLKSSSCKKWWTSIKQLTGSAPSGSNELESLANKLTDGNATELANRINQFFQAVSSDLPKPDECILPPRDPNEPIPDEYIISVVSVEKQLMRLDTSKAPGPDSIPTWVLKDFAGYLAAPVCAIYNTSLREGHLPRVWKAATTRPIPKVSPPKSIETDLRPISLTSIVGKELETHVVGWLWKLVWPRMDPYQFGALPNCSTVHALVEMLHDWYSQTDDSKNRKFIGSSYMQF
jgi:hypothetical protein